MKARLPFAAWSGLAELLDKPLEIVDVGCRWGPAQEWLQLGKVRIVGFDPDPDECRMLNENFRDNPDIQFVPLALGPASEATTLYLTKDPACSSLYPPSRETIDSHPELSVTAPRATVEVEIVTLDEWLMSQGDRSVDFIKLDTQGSELGVLQGSKNALRAVQVVETEVQFNPIYQGVPLFSDIDHFLRESGFSLWRLSNLAHYGLPEHLSDFERLEVQHFDTFASHFSGRGGQLFWANAFYVRQDMLREDTSAGWQNCLKQACISAALGFQDLAQKVLEKASSLAPVSACGPLDKVRANLYSL